MSQSDVDRLYKTYGYMIYGRCLRLLGSRDEARDAMQVVFMKLVQAYDTINDKEKVVPWIFRTARNYCFNLLRDRKKFVGEIDPDELSGAASGGDLYSNREFLRKVMGCFKTDIREAVYYTYIEEMNQREIQKITGQSPATVRRNLKRFRDALSGTLKRLGVDEL